MEYTRQCSYRFGDFTLEVTEHRLRRGSREIFLRPKAFDTLLFLVERHGHLVAKNEIVGNLWAGTVVSETVLTHCITEIRQALEDEPYYPRYIRTISGVGYRFIADVEEITRKSEENAEPVRDEPWPAIAVLPFVSLSDEPENEFFCQGLTEELVSGLTKIKGVHVVAHSLAVSLKGRDTDLREIGRKLNVRYLLEGSVQKAGKHLRISAQLAETADGYQLWAEQYDCELQDVFAMQDEVSMAILDRLKVRVLAEDRVALMRRSGRTEER